MQQPLVDIVVPVHNGLHHAVECLRSIEDHTGPSHAVTIVDDASSPAVGEWLDDLVNARETWTTLHLPHNVGFLGAANAGIRAGRAEWICLVNSDVLVTPGWLEGLLDAARSTPDVGVVTPLANHAHLTRIPIPYGATPDQIGLAVRAMSAATRPEIGVASGFCMLTRRAVFDELAGFDHAFAPGYFEEADFCMRAAARGWRTIADDATFVFHHGWASFGEDRRTEHMERNAAVFRSRWGDAADEWAKRIQEEAPWDELVEAVAADVPVPGGTHMGSGFRGAATAARTREPRPLPLAPVPSRWDGPRTWEPDRLPSVGVVASQILGDSRVVNDLRFACALLHERWHVTLVCPGPVDQSTWADPISLRPFPGHPDDLLARLSRHDAWVALDEDSLGLASRLSHRDGAACWRRELDETGAHWSDGHRTLRLDDPIDALAFAATGVGSRVVVPLPPRASTGTVYRCLADLADVQAHDAVVYGAPVPDGMGAGIDAETPGHLSLHTESSLLATAGVVHNIATDGPLPVGVGRALAAGLVVTGSRHGIPDEVPVFPLQKALDADERDLATLRARGRAAAMRQELHHVAGQFARVLAGGEPEDDDVFGHTMLSTEDPRGRSSAPAKTG